MAHRPVTPFVPALARANGQDYAVCHYARLRWKVRRLEYDWSVLTTKGSIPGWGFAPLWTRARDIVNQDAQDDERLMSDWPDSVIGTPGWARELKRRRAGKQPSLFSRLLEPHECLKPFKWETK